MPFTFAHAAAAWPFRRWCLIPSALWIGTFGPDLDFFLRLRFDRTGHTPLGVFSLALPISLFVLWLFHAVVKRPAAALLPDGVQQRLQDKLGAFAFTPASRFFAVVGWLLVGICLHLVWDSFTHLNSPVVQAWPPLYHYAAVPVFGKLPVYLILQDSSTLLGTAALLAWFIHWYREAPARPLPVAPLPVWLRVFIAAATCGIAFGGAWIRATLLHVHGREFPIQWVITAVALLWWQLIIFGLAMRFSRRRNC